MRTMQRLAIQGACDNEMKYSRFCIHGHDKDAPGGTYIKRDSLGKPYRQCAVCQRERVLAYQQRKKKEEQAKAAT